MSAESVHRAQRREDALDGRGVDLRVPRVVERLGLLGHGAQVPFAPRLASPVVDELVTRDADQPGDGHVVYLAALDGIACGEERLGREVLGEREVAASRLQVAVYLG